MPEEPSVSEHEELLDELTGDPEIQGDPGYLDDVGEDVEDDEPPNLDWCP